MPQKENQRLFRATCEFVAALFPVLLTATGDPIRALDMVAESIRNPEPFLQGLDEADRRGATRH